MDSCSIVFKDADEIESFYLSTTGMRPDFLQLSAGPVDIRHQVDVLDGVTLVWTRAKGRTRWCDEMDEGSLHLGFMIESSGPITVRGRAINFNDVQVWVPGKEIYYVMTGPLLSLEIGIERRLVNELGWKVKGEPLRRIPRNHLTSLIHTCRRASKRVRVLAARSATPLETAEIGQWRDLILDRIEPVLLPWLSDSSDRDLPNRSNTRHYSLVRRADEFFERLSYDTPFEVDCLAEALDVPRRTVFHAYRKLLGVGPRRYYELQRLYALRSRLKSTSPADTTVGDIAANLGFANLGRLPALYRQMFGENPSDTLKRG